MSNGITILCCMLLLGILCCVHGEKIMGQTVITPTNISSSEFPVGKIPAPAGVSQTVHRRSSKKRGRGHGRGLGSVFSCATGNPIDDCWRCDPNWRLNRKRLADCGIGFGKDAIGGKNGEFYVVTDPGDDPVNPWRGTLRYGVIQTEPLWIIFERDMVIRLKEELIFNSFKTIDGRGANVHIGKGGPCFTVQNVTNVIIHGLHISDCRPAGNAMVRDSPTHYGLRQVCDGDGITIFTGRNIWVDHCSMSNCADGLIDVVEASTNVTISNNHFTNHNEVMLLGHSDSYTDDTILKVTVAFNHFGKGLNERMPRCRFGHFHVVNNDYTEWEDYAIGGSSNPTILSQGNRFRASVDPLKKEVTRREIFNLNNNAWKTWNWISEDDLMLNGAYFVESGSRASSAYATAYSLAPRSSALVPALTRNAGVLSCRNGSPCQQSPHRHHKPGV
eukprot:PITA_07533